MSSRAKRRAAIRTAGEKLSRVSRKADGTSVATSGAYALTRLAAMQRQPMGSRMPLLSWPLSSIFSARDAQMQGQFERAVRLAEAMRTDDALHVARTNRLEAQKSITAEIKPAGDTARARAIAAEAEALYGPRGIGVTAATMADIEGCLVDHGIAIGLNTPVIREDASRVDLVHTCWPLEFVRYDSVRRQLVTRLDSGVEIPIVHGNGLWTVYAKYDDMPWRQDAAVLAAAVVWARHAYGNRDMAKASVAHGNPKVVGELPAGIALQDEAGALTDEAAALMELLRSVANDDTPYGIRPAGSKIDYLVNTSQAWQIWEHLITNAEKAAARIYLGTDGVLGSQGGAPGVDVNALFGVARTRVEGDLHCIEAGFYTGVLIPWTLLNFGDAAPAPRRLYQIPDADADAAVEATAKRRTAFYADIDAHRAQGFEVTQDAVDALAAAYQVDPPKLAAIEAKAPSANLAPTDLFRGITFNEARATMGLGPLLLPDGTRDPDGDIIITRLDERREREKVDAQKAADMEAEAAKIAAEQAASDAMAAVEQKAADAASAGVEAQATAATALTVAQDMVNELARLRKEIASAAEAERQDRAAREASVDGTLTNIRAAAVADREANAEFHREVGDAFAAAKREAELIVMTVVATEQKMGEMDRRVSEHDRELAEQRTRFVALVSAREPHREG